MNEMRTPWNTRLVKKTLVASLKKRTPQTLYPNNTSAISCSSQADPGSPTSKSPNRKSVRNVEDEDNMVAGMRRESNRRESYIYIYINHNYDIAECRE